MYRKKRYGSFGNNVKNVLKKRDSSYEKNDKL